MYFNDRKSDINRNKTFKRKNNILSSLLLTLSKYKKIIIISFIVIFLIIILLLFIGLKSNNSSTSNNEETVNNSSTSNNEETVNNSSTSSDEETTNNSSTSSDEEIINNYLVLNGEETITIYQGSDYIEPGYTAYNSKDVELTSEVVVESNLNVYKVGEYEITYTIGDITKVRKVIVIENPKEEIYLYLEPIDDSVDVYLPLGEKYNEPGFRAFTSNGKDLTDQVKVTGTVDTSKKGSYVLTYFLVDSDNVIISKARIVTIMDTDISLSLSPETYTNSGVNINVKVVDEYYDYTILPNNEKITTSTYSYQVNKNGKYTFTVYNTKGMSKKQTIEVKNIDKTIPTGSCTIDQYETTSIIKISANDEVGIQKYVYNNREYTSSTINLSTSINNAKITIYDNANNTQDITCTLIPKVYISNITQDGVIITVNAKKVNNDIKGYYFSYTNQIPNKNSGGYISTSKESIDIVRLPGTTYVWVEDKNGKISDVKTITLSNDVLLHTNGQNYNILETPSLSTYLSNQGWSIDELNKLMARSVRAAGLYTKEAAATAAISLQTVLAQKYNIKLPYWWGGKSWSYGANSTWGKYKVRTHNNITYYYYGLDCTGFITWAYVNAGYNIEKGVYPKYLLGWEKQTFNKENGDIGDFIVSKSHIKLIIGKTDTGFITAEAKGKASGMVVTIHPYSSSNGYNIQKGDLVMEKYSKVSDSNYPSGF